MIFGAYTVLQKGSKGSEVAKLQTMLKALDFGPSSVDGVFGSNTYSAVVSFQIDNQLPESPYALGVVSPQTWSAIETMYKAEGSPRLPDIHVPVSASDPGTAVVPYPEQTGIPPPVLIGGAIVAALAIDYIWLHLIFKK